MDIDDFGRGVAAALLTDQVNAKTGLAFKVSTLILLGAIILTVVTDSWLRWPILLVAFVVAAFIAVVWASKRFAVATISRIAPPMDITSARSRFDVALAEADLPTGPVPFLRMLWRLRKGVASEFDRLVEIVKHLSTGLD